MAQSPPDAAPPDAQAIAIDVLVEAWRLGRLLQRVIGKLDAGEGARYLGQVRYIQKTVADRLESLGFRLVNLEGTPYDPGVAASALNITDFEPEDVLIIDQMIDPVIMGRDGLVRAGTVMLRKASA